MGISSFHVHSRFCDGSGEPEEYILKALEAGFCAIGFSSHAPLPFENDWTMKKTEVQTYCQEIRRLQTKYRECISVYLGLEIDYLPGLSGPRSEQFNALNLDYVIGSIHVADFVPEGPYLSVDGSEAEYLQLLEQVYHGDIQAMVTDYFHRVREMVIIHHPDIVGHLDIIKKNNPQERYFSEKEAWYIEAVQATLELIARSGVIVEVNTGGIARNYVDDLYPSSWILAECRRLNIPIMLNSDAHHPEALSAYYDQALDRLACLGFEKQRILINHIWTEDELGKDIR